MPVQSKKEIRWMGSSKKDLEKFPEPAKKNLLKQIEAVRLGYPPKDIKPMQSIGANVYELRCKEDKNQYRVIYITLEGDKVTVNVLHSFQKKTQQTSKKDISTATSRLKDARAITREEKLNTQKSKKRK